MLPAKIGITWLRKTEVKLMISEKILKAKKKIRSVHWYAKIPV